MEARTYNTGDYYIVEVYGDDGRLLIRVGLDHEPNEEEIEQLLGTVISNGSIDLSQVGLLE